MKINQLGYRITELPGDGSIEVEPTDELDGGVRISVRLCGADRYVYTADEAMQLKDALERALLLAVQVVK